MPDLPAVDAIRASVVVLGVPVDDVTMNGAADAIVRLAAVGRERRTSNQVATVNLDFLANAVTDPPLLRLLQGTALNIADGAPIIWAAKALGTPLLARVAGVDLVDALAARSATTGLSLYLFGGAPGVAAEAARRLLARHPGATVLHATSTPRVSEQADTDRAALDEIRAADPDVVCVALGNPKQEWWIARHGESLGVPVLIGVGGTLDFIVGRRHRAPAWMQRVGLEWVARAAQEPARLVPRYARDALVCLPRFAVQWWRQRGAVRRRTWRPALVERGPADEIAIHAGPSLDLPRDAGLQALRLDGRAVRVDLAATETADASTIGTLAALARAARELRMENVRPELHRALTRAGILPMLTTEPVRSPDAAP